jgi:hypothetical protein
MTKINKGYESIFDEDWGVDWADETINKEQKPGFMLYAVVILMVVFGLAMLKAIY